MTKARFILIAVMAVLVCIECSLAKENFYWVRGNKVHIQVASTRISLKFKPEVSSTQIESVVGEEPALHNLKPLSSFMAPDFYTVDVQPVVDIEQLVAHMKSKSEIAYVNHVYKIDGLEAIPYDCFSVQFSPAASRAAINALNAELGVEIVWESSVAPNHFLLRAPSTSAFDILEICNLYYQRLQVEWAKPDCFIQIQPGSPPNDPYFINQYYLHNTGQTGGENDVDIDALEAWNISTGNPDITVAVIDDGVGPHEDLPSSRIVQGYDYVEFDGTPNPGGNQNHGVAAAGVVAATQNNNLGSSGVAPSCKIMPIRIFNEYGISVTSAWVRAAIDFAWSNNADVISCSWYYPTSDPNFDPGIVDAINDALTYGRGGKGCVVVFSAGNTAARPSNYGYVAFPANLPGVLAVGAIDKTNNIWNYSPRGAQVAFVAPTGNTSIGLSSLICVDGRAVPRRDLRGDVWSLDIMGDPGYNPGTWRNCLDPFYFLRYAWSVGPQDNSNYTAHFGGTSAACPQAAGVAALILSVNPNLQGNPANPQVQNIMKLTADVIENLPFENPDPDFGYGRINAYKALSMANGAPATPQGVQAGANPGNNHVRITWAQNPNPDIDIYEVSRQVQEEGPLWVVIGATTNTAFVDDDYLYVGYAGDFHVNYRVRAKDAAGLFSGYSSIVNIRGEYLHKPGIVHSDFPFSVEQNYPNPFNAVTTISFSLPSEGVVALKVFNILGQGVKTLLNETRTQGRYSISFETSELPSGLYIYELRHNGRTFRGTMIALK